MKPFALTIAGLFESACEKHPERLAVAFDGRRYTYRAWRTRVARLAQALAGLGVQADDRVALYLRTSEATAAAYLACQLLGAVAVPLNFRLAGGEALYIVRDCEARALVFDGSVESGVAQVLQAEPSLTAVRSGPGTLANVLDLEALIEASVPLARTAQRGPDDLCALVYTSGTTGRPKGVMHTNANDVAIAQNIIIEYQLAAEDVALHIAPLFHVGGMQAFFLPHLLVGAGNVIATRYEPGTTLAEIEREKITTLFAVPTQIQDMLVHPEFARRDHASLRLITTGGAAISEATMARVLDEFCLGIYNGYGMTEASLTLLLHPRDALSRLGSCGKATFISQCALRRRDGHGELEVPGEIGELWVRGPQMSPGYWNQPEQTAQRFTGGWLRTGDLFSRDADGYFYFHGRVDDMIVTGGENVYPREVEEVLYRCPGVQEAAVVGLPDARWGSTVTAFVVRKDAMLSAAQIDAFCRASGELAAFKRPRRIEFLDALPLNPSGKVLKRELVARYSNTTKV